MNNLECKNRKPLTKAKKIIFISLGVFFVVLAAVGVFVPILPTTPFLLVAAALFAKSSEALYRWLTCNRIFGRYLKNYWQGKGIPVKIKIYAITLLWIVIGISAFFVIKILFVRIILAVVAVAVTLHIIYIKPAKK
jgi:uncharacterized protein